MKTLPFKCIWKHILLHWMFLFIHSLISTCILCFVDSGKAYDRVRRGILWRVRRAFGVYPTCYHGSLGPCNHREVRLVPGERWGPSGLHPLSPIHDFHGQNIQAQRESGLVTSGSHVCYLQMRRSCSFHRALPNPRPRFSGFCSGVRGEWSVRSIRHYRRSVLHHFQNHSAA